MRLRTDGEGGGVCLKYQARIRQCEPLVSGFAGRFLLQPCGDPRRLKKRLGRLFSVFAEHLPQGSPS